jgi:hypothetical protein
MPVMEEVPAHGLAATLQNTSCTPSSSPSRQARHQACRATSVVTLPSTWKNFAALRAPTLARHRVLAARELQGLLCCLQWLEMGGMDYSSDVHAVGSALMTWWRTGSEVIHGPRKGDLRITCQFEPIWACLWCR